MLRGHVYRHGAALPPTIPPTAPLLSTSALSPRRARDKRRLAASNISGPKRLAPQRQYPNIGDCARHRGRPKADQCAPPYTLSWGTKRASSMWVTPLSGRHGRRERSRPNELAGCSTAATPSVATTIACRARPPPAATAMLAKVSHAQQGGSLAMLGPVCMCAKFDWGCRRHRLNQRHLRGHLIRRTRS